jgi:hypothetical protein
MNYSLDDDEKQILQLLQTAKAEGSFDKYAYANQTYEYRDGDTNFTMQFYHRKVHCEIKFSSKHGTFSFCIDENSVFHSIAIEKKYCITKSRFFGLIRETSLDVNHPIVDASLTIYKEIMQKAADVDTLKRQKTWDKLLGES